MTQTRTYVSGTIYIGAIILGILLILGGFAILVGGCYVASKKGGTYIPGALPYLLVAAGLGIIGWGARGMTRLGHASATEKKRIADKEVRVYKDTDSRSPIVATLVEGSEVKLGEIKEVNDLEWVSVISPDGQLGYVLGNVGVYTVLKAIIVSREALVYRYADSNFPPIAKFVAGSEIEISKVDWDSAVDGVVWVRAWLPDGQQGYINRGTKIKWA